MAELVAGAFLGSVVSELLKGVIRVLKNLKHKDKNVRRLEERLRRLEPLVKELTFIQDQRSHPVGNWLQDLRQQLDKAHDLVQDSAGGPLKRLLASGKLEQVNENISLLLEDAQLLQLRELMGFYRGVAEAVTSEPPHLREREIRCATSQLDRAIHSFRNVNGDSSLSSAASDKTPRGNKASDAPKPPKVSFGGEAVAEEQIKNLLYGEYKKWVVIWGMGGVGKTFTARNVYHDPRISQHFTGGTFWITVSKDHPPPPLQLLKLLYEQLKGREPGFKFPDNLEAAKAVLERLLHKDRVLLVLDDVWQPLVLEHLDVISESKKGVILITTRDQGNLKNIVDCRTGKRAVNCARIVDVPRLSQDHSWQLFSWHAFNVHGRDVPPDLKAVAEDVADECKGLPLALRVIGATMGGIHLFSFDKKLGLSLCREWKKALDQLRSTNHGNDDYVKLYQKLQLSVDHLLEQDSRLQDCFFSFAAFPEDHEVKVEELVSLWIAEGLVGNHEHDLLSRKEEAKVLLGLLIAKSMIELTDDGESCKVHDVMRGLAHRNLKWNFRMKQEIQVSERRCLYAAGLKLREFPVEWTTPKIQFSVERLSFHTNDLWQLPNQMNAPSLRVLILHRNQRLRHLPRTFFQVLSNLRVLDLSYSSIERIHSTILENLKSLVLLDLRECSKLEKISDVIDRIQSLETIYLQGCYRLKKLPRVKSLTKLHTYSLPLIDVNDTRYGFSFPQHCHEWRTHSDCSIYGIHEVFQLHNLRRLHLGRDIRCTRTDTHVPDISSLCALEELTLARIPSLPADILKLQNLKILVINNYYGKAVPALNELPHLEGLSMSYISSELPESFGHDGAFPSLQRLAISDMWSMERFFTFHPGTMPKLESLTIAVFGLEEWPLSLTVLRSLRHLAMVPDNRNLESIFRQPNCFPNLEVLKIPRGAKENLPKHIVERERQGKLEINHMDDHLSSFLQPAKRFVTSMGSCTNGLCT